MEIVQVPSIKIDLVHRLVDELYGIKVINVTSFNSYDDKTFHISVDANYKANDCIGKIDLNGYVFKIIHESGSGQKRLEAQSTLLQHCYDPHVSIPYFIPNKEGKFWSIEYIEYDADLNKARNKTGGYHGIVLMSFLPGVPICKFEINSRNVRSCGSLLAKLHIKLNDVPRYSPMNNDIPSETHYPPLLLNPQNFQQNNSTEKSNDEYFLWSLFETPKALKFTQYLNDPNREELATNAIRALQTQVLSKLDSFPQLQLHGDPNEQNILVNPSNPDEVVGILDFWDSYRGLRVFDLALCMLYLSLDAPAEKQIELQANVFAGYFEQILEDKKLQITQPEMDNLKTCMTGRCAQSLILGNYSYHLNPSTDNDYVLITQKNGWTFLKRFMSMDNKEYLRHLQEVLNRLKHDINLFDITQTRQ